MSARHLFNQPEGLVAKALRGIVSYNPSLALIETEKVVYDTTHSRSNVSVLSGGGAGHEPAFAGYVGHNMLAAGISGDMFASPSTKQILSAIDAVPSDKGTILVILNYTGDCLHFGLAREKTNATNKSPCGIIICGDDVSVGKTVGAKVGRRGLAGQVAVLKIIGAAAATGASYEDCMSLGTAVSDQLVSIAATLDHCSVPGRSEHAALELDEVELGTGPHNEPGYFKISPIPKPSDFIANILKYLLDKNDRDRGYVQFSPGDEVVLMVSNFGGMSSLEMGALADELLNQLDQKYSIQPCRVYNGPILTSLNAPGYSTTLLNLTTASKNTTFTVSQIKDFLDVRTNTAWEANAGEQSKRRPRKDQFVAAREEVQRSIDPKEDLQVESSLLESAIRRACENLISAEADLTRWDTIMGDGDCGETLKTGATAMLSALDNGLGKSGSVVKVLHELENIVESKMGGTLGGILGIFFVSLTTALRQNVKSSSGVQLWGSALKTALNHLERYTPAKVGDRTIMDVLIPFATTLEKTGSCKSAVDVSIEAANKTKQMRPKLGRATYVGDMEGKELPPDPGAWAALEAIRGLLQGLT